MNPYGHVVAENVEGINTVNGHSYADPSLRSENTNFALLVSNRFPQPFNEPYRYGKHIASLSNRLAGGVLVQRFGDLVKGVRTNEHRLGKSFTRPTLTAAVPGDLDVYKRQLPGRAGHPPRHRGGLGPGRPGDAAKILRLHRLQRQWEAHQQRVHCHDRRPPPAPAEGGVNPFTSQSRFELIRDMNNLPSSE